MNRQAAFCSARAHEVMCYEVMEMEVAAG